MDAGVFLGQSSMVSVSLIGLGPGRVCGTVQCYVVEYVRTSTTDRQTDTAVPMYVNGLVGRAWLTGSSSGTTLASQDCS
jgi:hypothetical protein